METYYEIFDANHVIHGRGSREAMEREAERLANTHTGKVYFLHKIVAKVSVDLPKAMWEHIHEG